MSEMEVPDGWNNEKLSSILESRLQGLYYNQGYFPEGVPLLRISDMTDDGKINYATIPKIHIEKKEIERFRLRKGDIVIARTGGAGRTAIFEDDKVESVFAGYLIRFRFKSVIDPYFMNYFLRSPIVQSKLLGSRHGGVMKNINAQNVLDLDIFYPSLQIQKKIVKKLDDVLGKLEEKRKEILPRMNKLENSFSQIPPSFGNRIIAKNNLFLIMRNHVLKTAFSGTISEKFRKNKIKYKSNWHEDIQQEISQIRKNLKKSKTDFKIIPNEDAKLFPIPTEWIWTNIESMETMVGSGVTPKGGKSNYIENGIPFIRSQNVLFNKLDLSTAVHIPKEIHENMKRSHVKADDVLLNITGASIGRSTSVPSDFQEGNVNQHVCIIRTGNWINPKYLSFWLNSQFIQNFINSIQIGATKEGLNYEHIRSFPIPLPKIEEQYYIVDELEKKIQNLIIMQKQMKNSLNFQKSTLKIINGLNSSILNSAFSGKLVN